MIIGVDASSVTASKTGVGQYTYQLLKALGKIDTKNEYRLFMAHMRNKLDDNPFTEFDNFEIIRPALPFRAYVMGWKYLGLPRADKLVGGCDLFWSPNFFVPPVKKSKLVVTIHDLYFMIHPEETKKSGGRYFAESLPKQIHKADGVITVSEATKKDTIKYFNLEEKKIKTIHSGVDERFAPASNEEIEAMRKELKIEDPFLLFVGTLEPRKNLGTLVKAFAKAKEKGLPHKLVLVGAKGWQFSDVFENIKKLGLESQLIYPGYVKDEMMPILYSAADMLVMPSQYEGFGFPIVEAMACGTPVLTSNISSMPEIASSYALYVNPDNENEIVDNLLVIVEKPEIKHDFRAKVCERAAQFSWEKAAQETLNYFMEICN